MIRCMCVCMPTPVFCEHIFYKVTLQYVCPSVYSVVCLSVNPIISLEVDELKCPDCNKTVWEGKTDRKMDKVIYRGAKPLKRLPYVQIIPTICTWFSSLRTAHMQKQWNDDFVLKFNFIHVTYSCVAIINRFHFDKESSQIKLNMLYKSFSSRTKPSLSHNHGFFC